MDPCGALHVVDLALPLVRGRVADVDERLRALQRIADISRTTLRHAVEGEDPIALELIHQAAGIQHLIPRLRIERGEHVAHDRVVGGVAHVAGLRTEVGEQDGDALIQSRRHDRLRPELMGFPKLSEAPKPKVPEERRV